jgi:hypothetical protein
MNILHGTAVYREEVEVAVMKAGSNHINNIMYTKQFHRLVQVQRHVDASLVKQEILLSSCHFSYYMLLEKTENRLNYR